MGRNKKAGGFNSPFDKLAELKAQMTPPPAPSKFASKAKAQAQAAPPPAPAKPKAISDEELFLQEVQGVAKIAKRPDGGRVGGPAAAADTGAARKRGQVGEDAEVLAELADLCDGDGTFDISDTDEYIEGLGPGIDRRLLRRLRNGDFAVQGHVDLHGMTRDEAKLRVTKFVDESRRAGRRCVLIVHGRGLHSKDQIPVLKEAVRTWLERGPVARAVLAFATARPHDGGAGAVYVLLRR
jgi:DNA-nicking Smr family endonuclease